jgi:hypothetical protein
VNEIKIFSCKIQREKLGKRKPLKDVILIKTAYPQSIKLPIGYEIWTNEGKAYNFAEKTENFYLFLA